MDLPGPSNTVTKFCQLCGSCPRKYTCPRCSIPYCSVECYKSTSHLDCSEEFYKEWVENEMKDQQNDPADKKKMLEILTRFYASEMNLDTSIDSNIDENILNVQDISDESIDSDDDNEISNLNKRIENVDLNNADDLWAVLTDAEKQEFEAIIKNGEEDTLLSQWTPWWSKIIKNKTVKIIGEDENADYMENCPCIVEISPIPTVEKASPLMCYNLLNILSAYALMTLHYNGEHESSAFEAITFFLQLNDVFGSNTIFENTASAITSVLEKAIDYELIETNERTTLLHSIRQIIQGPCKEKQNYYMAVALSDLHQLFIKVKSEIRDSYERNFRLTFSQKFRKDIQSRYSTLTKKHLQLYIKKVEYYLAWINRYGERMNQLELS